MSRIYKFSLVNLIQDFVLDEILLILPQKQTDVTISYLSYLLSYLIMSRIYKFSLVNLIQDFVLDEILLILPQKQTDVTISYLFHSPLL
jgi:hypothetical protein